MALVRPLVESQSGSFRINFASRTSDPGVVVGATDGAVVIGAGSGTCLPGCSARRLNVEPNWSLLNTVGPSVVVVVVVAAVIVIVVVAVAAVAGAPPPDLDVDDAA